MKNLHPFFLRIKTLRFSLMMSVSVLLLVCTVLFSLCVGAADYTLSELIRNADILRYIRIPRILAALSAGAGLAGCGVIIQTLLGNTLAGPNIIGVNSGAGFMTLVAVAAFPLVPQLQPAAAFVGAMMSVSALFLLSRRINASKMTILLTGVILNSLFNAASEALCTFFPEISIANASFRTGGLSVVRTSVLWPAMALIAVAAVIAIIKADVLEILSLGDDAAFALGINVSGYRLLFLLCAACMAGASVSFAGLIGFLGLIVPHAARLVAGDEIRKLLPLSMLWGAFLLLICDTVARTAFAPFELSVGIVISVIGAPVFIRMLLKRKPR